MDNIQLIADVRLSNYIHGTFHWDECIKKTVSTSKFYPVSAVTVFAYDLVRSFPEEVCLSAAVHMSNTEYLTSWSTFGSTFVEQWEGVGKLI